MRQFLLRKFVYPIPKNLSLFHTKGGGSSSVYWVAKP